MKIAIVTQSYYPRPGGVTEVVHHTAYGLRMLGHEVRIVTTHYGGAETPDPDDIRIGRNVLVPMNGALVNMTVGVDLASQLRASSIARPSTSFTRIASSCRPFLFWRSRRSAPARSSSEPFTRRRRKISLTPFFENPSP